MVAFEVVKGCFWHVSMVRSAVLQIDSSQVFANSFTTGTA